MAVKPAPLAHHFADCQQQHEAASLGMWIFLATELMFFGGLFLGYTVYRYLYPREFAAASQHLNLAFGGINTIVLLTSSLTMALAVFAAQQNRQEMLTTCLWLTALLGTAFLVIKGFEYYADYSENLIPGLAFHDEEWSSIPVEPRLQPQHVKLFLMFYYFMTGLHAIHLIIGIVLMLLLALQARRGQYSANYYYPVEVGGLYWHFVDVVWIFLLPLLYMIGVRGGTG